MPLGDSREVAVSGEVGSYFSDYIETERLEGRVEVEEDQSGEN